MVYLGINQGKGTFSIIANGEGKQAARCLRNHLDTSGKALEKTAQNNAEQQDDNRPHI